MVHGHHQPLKYVLLFTQSLEIVVHKCFSSYLWLSTLFYLVMKVILHEPLKMGRGECEVHNMELCLMHC